MVEIAQKPPWGMESFPSQSDQDAVMALSDQAKQVAATRQAAMEANTAQNLQTATTGQGQMRALNDRVADHTMRDTELDPQAQPREYLDALSRRILKMKKLAKDAQETTGNTSAANTYLQVAEILTKRLRTFQTEFANRLSTEADQAGAIAQAQARMAQTPRGQQ